MTKDQAQQILFDAMVDHVHVTDDPELREALETLCPHTQYVHGGSMGDVCAVCGLMPPEPPARDALDIARTRAPMSAVEG